MMPLDPAFPDLPSAGCERRNAIGPQFCARCAFASEISGRSAVAFFFANRDVVAPHEAVFETRGPHLDPPQPFDVGDPVPAGRDQPQWKAVLRRHRRAVDLVAQQIVGAHGIGDPHAACEARRHLDVAHLLLAGVCADKDHLNAAVQQLRLTQHRRQRCPGPSGGADARLKRPAAVVARAFKREDQLPARPRPDVAQTKPARFSDEAGDLQRPVPLVDVRTIIVGDVEELGIGRQPIEIFPALQVLDSASGDPRVGRGLIRPRNDFFAGLGGEGLRQQGAV
jgi:hypothetical protein